MTDRDTLRIGDLVVLRSGGPLMTVGTLRDDAGGEPVAGTGWFDGGTFREGHFALVALVKIEITGFSVHDSATGRALYTVPLRA